MIHEINKNLLKSYENHDNLSNSIENDDIYENQ